MLNILDLEEKRLIVAYSMARDKKHIGLENVWRQWCMWWKEDFTVNDGALKMYDHKLVKSKTKVRERIKAGETDIQEFKEYDDFLAELCEWISTNYNKTVLYEKLLSYKVECNRKINVLFKKSGLKEQGYKLQNNTSKKHPLLLGKHFIFYRESDGIWKCVAQGTYEQVTNWINNKAEVKNKK